MKREVTITERVKFLIRYIIGQGIASSQEDLGKKLGITNKSYLSQLVNCRIPNNTFIDSLLNYTPEINKEWLYNEEITQPLISDKVEICLNESEVAPEERIKDLENMIKLLKKDVRYYADIAEVRLQTIEIQNKLINKLEEEK